MPRRSSTRRATSKKGQESPSRTGAAPANAESRCDGGTEEPGSASAALAASRPEEAVIDKAEAVKESAVAINTPITEAGAISSGGPCMEDGVSLPRPPVNSLQAPLQDDNTVTGKHSGDRGARDKELQRVSEIQKPKTSDTREEDDDAGDDNDDSDDSADVSSESSSDSDWDTAKKRRRKKQDSRWRSSSSGRKRPLPDQRTPPAAKRVKAAGSSISAATLATPAQHPPAAAAAAAAATAMQAPATGQQHRPPLKRGPQRRQASCALGLDSWTSEERHAAVEFIARNHLTEIDYSLLRATQTPAEIEEFVAGVLKQVPSLDSVSNQGALDDWLSCMKEVASRAELPSSHNSLEDIVLEFSQENYPTPGPGTPDYSLIYKYLAACLAPKHKLPNLGYLERATVCSLLSDLPKEFARHDLNPAVSHLVSNFNSPSLDKPVNALREDLATALSTESPAKPALSASDSGSLPTARSTCAASSLPEPGASLTSVAGRPTEQARLGTEGSVPPAGSKDPSPAAATEQSCSDKPLAQAVDGAAIVPLADGSARRPSTISAGDTVHVDSQATSVPDADVHGPSSASAAASAGDTCNPTVPVTASPPVSSDSSVPAQSGHDGMLTSSGTGTSAGAGDVSAVRTSPVAVSLHEATGTSPDTTTVLPDGMLASPNYDTMLSPSKQFSPTKLLAEESPAKVLGEITQMRSVVLRRLGAANNPLNIPSALLVPKRTAPSR